MAAPTSTNEVTARKLSSSISALWTKIKSTFQPVADRVTSWSSTPSDTKYPSEKLVKDSLDGKANSADAELSTTSTNPLQNKEITRWHNIIIGDDGFVSGSAAYPQLSLQKLKLGALSHYNKGVNIKIYTYDEGDEENASLVFDIANASDSVKDNFYNGLSMDTLFQSEAGKYVKIVYTGSTSCYFRALGVFMDTKDTSSTVSLFYGHLRISNVDYPESGQFSTLGTLVVAAFSKASVTVAELILRPKTSASKCRIYGFRCLNTYTGSDWAVLIGRATSALRLTNSRKLCVDLSRTADSTFDGSADQTNIPVKNTLPVARGGTGKASVTAGNYVVGNGTSAMVEKTPKEVGSNVLSSLDDKSNASSYANFVDGDFVVGSDHVDASTISASTFVRRTALNLWNYIKSKLTGSDVNIGGNAATATKATQDADGNAINTSYKKLAGSSKFTEPQWIDNKTRSSYNDLRIGNSSKLLSLGITSAGNLLLKELADGRTNSPAQDKSIIYTYNGGTTYNFNGNAATASALADETGFVHTTGNETVGGKKTFTDAEVNSESSSGTYSGFFVKRTAVDDDNKVYRVSLEVSDNGSRGIYDYGGSGLNGENKWILRKRPDGSIAIGESTNINKISIGGITLDFSGSLGNAANTLYFGWAGGGSS